MTGKVEIFYSYNHWKGGEPEPCECTIIWYPLGEDKRDTTESFTAHAVSFPEAREKALAIFKMLPPSEELVVEADDAA